MTVKSESRGQMHDALYGVPAPLIAAVLMIGLAAALEIGYRIGLLTRRDTDEPWRARVVSVEAAMLGLLALIIGFTFSLSLQRYDLRTRAVVDEANAIGTTWLRSHFLIDTVRADTQALLERYAGQRACDRISTADARRDALLQATVKTQDALWRCARAAVAADPNEVRTGLYVEALNPMFDSYGSHNALLANLVPRLVVWLLFATLLISIAIVGYACGLSGHRAGLVTNGFMLLIVLVVYLVIDLDRPRRGLVTVDWSALTDAHAAIVADRRATVAEKADAGQPDAVCHAEALRLIATPACDLAASAAGAEGSRQAHD
jgi:hypothetical protein